MNVLVINCGSSSIKYKLFSMPQEQLLSKGLIEHIGEKKSKIPNHYVGFKIILHDTDCLDAVGHRVVHGAEKFRKPVLVNSSLIDKIRDCCPLAPLHNPANLEGILACGKLLPGIKQVAVFDTAFHQTLPKCAYIYGLPYKYYAQLGIRKYGFHGTSHEYVTTEAARILKKPLQSLKIISCHLGNGCSITAVYKGRSIDTSMGFTPLEGLVMGTRCGDIDPAVVIYLMQKEKLSISQIDNLLNKESGLLGISGISNDMRLLVAKYGNQQVRLSIDVFVYRIQKYIGAYAAIMRGCDALVFTAGIGEHQGFIRKRICSGIFSSFKKKPRILVIPTDEELMIARQTYKLISGS